MSDESRIEPLDEATVQRIAAGEVVERPASVVKELVENSLDAGADRVSVAVEEGGTERVRVRDDGRGMGPADLERAVEEHTTSKISDLTDLERGVGTLGFRGEALHTIAAVARVTIRSRRAGDDVGHELTVEGGDVGEVEPVGCPVGTVVEVADLFYNTPARKKFLKTIATEFDHVNTVVTQYALANPDVAVSLEHDGREVFSTEGNGDLRSTVLSVYGREVAEAMVEVDWDGGEDDAVDAVRGLVSHPETNRAGRDYLATFVNDRYVTAGALRDAVIDAYGGQLAADRYPFAVLFVDLDPATVDVNVHPRKMEVRFDDEPGVADTVEGAVRDALLSHGLVRSTAPRGRSAAEETEIEPRTEGGADGRGDGQSTPGDPDVAGESGPDQPASTDRADGVAGDEVDVAAEDSTTRIDTADEDAWTVSPSRGERADAPGNEVVDAGDDAPAPGLDASPATDTNASPTTDTEGDATEPPPGPRGPEDANRSDVDHGGGFEPPTSQRTLAGDEVTPGADFDNLPRLRVLGQLDETYVVAESDAGLVLVDQHAADERINYERLRAELDGETAAQALAEPVDLELTAREAELFAEYEPALEHLGFRAERADDRTVAVEAVPAVFDAALDPDLLRDVLTAFVADERDGGADTVAEVADELLADLACYPAVTGNTSLTEGSVVDLLAELDDCENPWACPHGRPVVVELGLGDIEDRFERDYPGHGRHRRT